MSIPLPIVQIINLENFDWCDEMKPLEDLLNNGTEMVVKEIEKTFQDRLKTIRLYNRKITEIDKGLLLYSKLQEISLTGNFIENIQNIPSLVKVLHLNANRIKNLPYLGNLTDLIHIGLSFNYIQSFPSNKIFPNNLTSLDLSMNSLYDLVETVNAIKYLSNLKIATFMVLRVNFRETQYSCCPRIEANF
jgi:Leucine-rich repeat (LRR) protein